MRFKKIMLLNHKIIITAADFLTLLKSKRIHGDIKDKVIKIIKNF
jgi:hypothetical protein